MRVIYYLKFKALYCLTQRSQPQQNLVQLQLDSHEQFSFQKNTKKLSKAESNSNSILLFEMKVPIK